MRFFSQHKKALVWAIAVGLYFKFALIPTAMLFYELYHATGISFIYWGYSIFKVAGYYFGVWQYQTLSCIAIALTLFSISIWRSGRRNGVETSV